MGKKKKAERTTYRYRYFYTSYSIGSLFDICNECKNCKTGYRPKNHDFMILY